MVGLALLDHPECGAGEVSRQTIGNAAAEEACRARWAVPGDDEGAIAAGADFIQNRVDDIARVSQFQRHSVGRKPRVPESLKRPFEDGIFQGLLHVHPFLLVFAELFAELMLHVRIFRAAMFHQFAGHGV